MTDVINEVKITDGTHILTTEYVEPEALTEAKTKAKAAAKPRPSRAKPKVEDATPTVEDAKPEVVEVKPALEEVQAVIEVPMEEKPVAAKNQNHDQAEQNPS